MAVINYTLHHFGGSLGTARTIVKWSSLAAGDTGQPFDVGENWAISIGKETSGEDISAGVLVANTDTSPAPGSTQSGCAFLGSIGGNLLNTRGRWYWPEAGEGADTVTIYLLVGPPASVAIA